MKNSDKCVCLLATNSLLTYKLAQNLANCGFHVELFSHDKNIVFTSANISVYTFYNQTKLADSLKHSSYIINLLLAPIPENYSNFFHNLKISKQAMSSTSLQPIFINVLPLCREHNFLNISKEFKNINQTMANLLKRYNQVYIGHIMSNQNSLLTDLMILNKNSIYATKNYAPISIIDEDDLITGLITIIKNNYIGKVFNLAYATQLSTNLIQDELQHNSQASMKQIKSILYLKLLNSLYSLDLKFLSNNYLKLLSYSKNTSSNNITLQDLGITPSNLDVIIHKYISQSL